MNENIVINNFCKLVKDSEQVHCSDLPISNIQQFISVEHIVANLTLQLHYLYYYLRRASMVLYNSLRYYKALGNTSKPFFHYAILSMLSFLLFTYE